VGVPDPSRCRTNVAHISQSRPDSEHGLHVQVLQTVSVGPFSLGSGRREGHLIHRQFVGNARLVYTAHMRRIYTSNVTYTYFYVFLM